jgi:NifU-like protein involved in Fe-S cluster formation
MSADPYSATVRELFADPRHGGDLANATAIELAQQGIRIRLALSQADGRIESLCFQAYGCPHVIAACELFCRTFEGRPIAAIDGFRAADIIRDLSVPVEKTGRILVVEDAVSLLGQKISGRAAT